MNHVYRGLGAFAGVMVFALFAYQIADIVEAGPWRGEDVDARQNQLMAVMAVGVLASALTGYFIVRALQGKPKA